MTVRLADIRVAVEPVQAGLGPGVTALLYEIADRLDKLAESGQAEAIDLRGLPLSAVERSLLREVLGEGEIEATLNVDGVSHVAETGIPGVWWVDHRDLRGEPIAELIEIARIPEILCTAEEELFRGAALLRARLAGEAGPNEEAP